MHPQTVFKGKKIILDPSFNEMPPHCHPSISMQKFNMASHGLYYDMSNYEGGNVCLSDQSVMWSHREEQERGGGGGGGGEE